MIETLHVLNIFEKKICIDINITEFPDVMKMHNGLVTQIILAAANNESLCFLG